MGMLATAAVVGCGGDGLKASKNTLTVYSSLPYDGEAGAEGRTIEEGIRLALAEHDNKAGDFTLHYEPLSDSTPQDGGWSAKKTAENARTAASNDNTIAYIGEYNSGATEIALPILNEAGIPMVSPASTAVGLTVGGPAAAGLDPQRLYPSGRRTFVRVIPNDAVQGAALAELMRTEGCRRSAIVDDGERYGTGLSRDVQAAAGRLRLEVVSATQMDPDAGTYRPLARQLAGASVDCVVFAGDPASNAARLFEDLHAELPRATLFGAEGLGVPEFLDPRRGGIAPGTARRVRVTSASLPPAAYSPAGAAFARDYVRRFGHRPGQLTIYGYEAMNLVIDAIERAGADGDDRMAVTEQLFRTQDRDSVIGSYGIDPNGDTTLTTFGAYTIVNGTLRFDRRLEPDTR
jgi:branched-chain amino acid transport system substrate-binding protein